MVRDLYARDQSARILSLNMLVTASAPVVAPLIGGQVLLWLDWRAIFWVLVGFGAARAHRGACAARNARRRRAATKRIRSPCCSAISSCFRNQRYVGYVACSTLYFCCLFAFIAGSPFVYIEYFGVPPQYYGFLFGVNMLGMIATTYVNSRIVVRRGADRLLRIACSIGAAGSRRPARHRPARSRRRRGNCAALVCRVVGSDRGGLQRHFRRACPCCRTGPARRQRLPGALQFGAGALTSAAVGWFADGTPRPMIVVICAGAVAALLANLVLLGKPRD